MKPIGLGNTRILLDFVPKPPWTLTVRNLRVMIMVEASIVNNVHLTAH